MASRRGLPQGLIPSDSLATLYLAEADFTSLLPCAAMDSSSRARPARVRQTYAGQGRGQGRLSTGTLPRMATDTSAGGLSGARNRYGDFIIDAGSLPASASAFAEQLGRALRAWRPGHKVPWLEVPRMPPH